MMAGDDNPDLVAGAPRHTPVLVDRVVEWLAVQERGLYVDATFGAGGYTRAILQTAGARVIGIDRDQGAIARGADLVEQAQGRLELVEERFGNLQSVVAEVSADGVVFDLGVSSMQLDQAERGFSFRLDGPLDMRMGRDGPSAADVVARATALLDRLLHHAVVIAIEGNSYRLREHPDLLPEPYAADRFRRSSICPNHSNHVLQSFRCIT